MNLSGYTVEYQVGRVAMIPSNILIKDVRDMEAIEFWETRLKRLRQPFTVVYRDYGGVVLYSIFTNLRNKTSVFK